MANYPVPHREGDGRLSSGLISDVRTLLLRHGFPELSRVDLTALETALARFLYRPVDSYRPVGTRDPMSHSAITHPIGADGPPTPSPGADYESATAGIGLATLGDSNPGGQGRSVAG